MIDGMHIVTTPRDIMFNELDRCTKELWSIADNSLNEIRLECINSIVNITELKARILGLVEN